MNSTMLRLAIVGAGGMARDTRWLVEEINRHQARFQFLGYIVSSRVALGPYDSVAQVLGDFDWLQSHGGEIDALAMGVGTPALRKSLSEQADNCAPGKEWPALVHPGVLLDFASLSLGRGSFIAAGVVGTVNIHIGQFAFVNPACTLGHEAVIGAYSGLNHGANVGGGVVIGEEVLVGTGAQILQYRRVERGATVGAGAVVTHDVPEGVTVVGVPARPMSR